MIEHWPLQMGSPRLRPVLPCQGRCESRMTDCGSPSSKKSLQAGGIEIPWIDKQSLQVRQSRGGTSDWAAGPKLVFRKSRRRKRLAQGEIASARIPWGLMPDEDRSRVGKSSQRRPTSEFRTPRLAVRSELNCQGRQGRWQPRLKNPPEDGQAIVVVVDHQTPGVLCHFRGLRVSGWLKELLVIRAGAVQELEICALAQMRRSKQNLELISV